MIEFPSADDYVKAVQHPEHNFTSGELKTAHFPVHPLLGIPMPASGSSAVVFKAMVGGEEQALRFFTRRDVSSRGRYNALNHYFETCGIADCMAISRWFDDAIVVKGRTWPVVRMQWVNGRTLDQYIDGLVEDDNAPGIGALVIAWRNLLGRMQRAGFAHGDLQHGNVLVDANGSLRLVDFDCSWIAPFAGNSPPTESGHRNYQHPRRLWGQWMDTFPGLVIYTSLLALSKKPRLWDALNDGENLIFRLEDFDPPYHADVWKHLSNVGDGELDARLKECCAPSWLSHGTLEALLRPRWWDQTCDVQSTTATTRDRPQWWEPEPGASLPLPQPPPPTQPKPHSQPLPAPKKIAASRTSPSIPAPRPPSKPLSWPHAPSVPTSYGPTGHGNWWGRLPGTPPGNPPIPPPQPTPAAKNRGVSPVNYPPGRPRNPHGQRVPVPRPAAYLSKRDWAIAAALIVLATILVLGILAAVSPILKTNPTSPYTAMQLFGATSYNGTCYQQNLKYSVTTYDVEVVSCSSGTYPVYTHSFYKYSGTQPDGWVDAARQHYSSLQLEQANSCYNIYSTTYTSTTTGELYYAAFFVYQAVPFVARVDARASNAYLATVINLPHYLIDPASGSPMSGPGPLC
jgi:hypothetical protein